MTGIPWTVGFLSHEGSYQAALAVGSEVSVTLCEAGAPSSWTRPDVAVENEVPRRRGRRGSLMTVAPPLLPWGPLTGPRLSSRRDVTEHAEGARAVRAAQQPQCAQTHQGRCWAGRGGGQLEPPGKRPLQVSFAVLPAWPGLLTKQ